MDFDDSLVLPGEIRKIIYADSLASVALHELERHGVNVDAILALLPIYIQEVRAPKQAACFEAGTFGTDGHFRQIKISRHELNSLPGRLTKTADDVLLAGFLRPLPPNLDKTYKDMRTLAEWLKKNPPHIPDSRLLRGKTTALRLMLNNAIPRNCKAKAADLGRYIARVIEPVAEHFEVPAPTQESLQKIIERAHSR